MFTTSPSFVSVFVFGDKRLLMHPARCACGISLQPNIYLPESVVFPESHPLDDYNFGYESSVNEQVRHCYIVRRA